MITINLDRFEDPFGVFVWMCGTWGPPQFNNDRWDLRELRYLDLQYESDLTFLLLKWNLKNDKWNTK